jgi:Na+-transporting methylmalonyl-CoA/oxaloacetate decarboxylase gamma subunit
MTGVRVHLSETPQLVKGESRRHFLLQLSALCLSTVLFPAKRASAIGADSPTAAQWARIKRGLPKKTIIACERVANRLAPQMATLLKGSKWEVQTYKAIVDELKSEGVDPDREAGREADRLRSEAESRQGSANAVTSSLAAIGAIAASTITPVGPIIAAVLLVLAAVIMLIGQIIQKAQEDQAAARDPAAKAKEKETKDQLKKIRTMEAKLVKLMESLDDCVLFRKNCK